MQNGASDKPINKIQTRNHRVSGDPMCVGSHTEEVRKDGDAGTVSWAVGAALWTGQGHAYLLVLGKHMLKCLEITGLGLAS